MVTRPGPCATTSETSVGQSLSVTDDFLGSETTPAASRGLPQDVVLPLRQRHALPREGPLAPGDDEAAHRGGAGVLGDDGAVTNRRGTVPRRDTRTGRRRA